MPINFYANNCVRLILLVLILPPQLDYKILKESGLILSSFCFCHALAHDDDDDSQHLLKSLLLSSLDWSKKDKEAECFACVVSYYPYDRPIREVIISVTLMRRLSLTGLIIYKKSHSQVEKSIQIREILKPAFLNIRTHLFFVRVCLIQDILIIVFRLIDGLLVL